MGYALQEKAYIINRTTRECSTLMTNALGLITVALYHWRIILNRVAVD